ncbi:MAG: hypothetical protein R3242_08370 [Akkermansiaceae bacterium]|nr:hypothetical protein [Akkermansiaceae bacterium]
MKQFFIIVGMALFPLVASLQAQNNNNNQDDDGITDQQQRERFWEANIGTGQFMVSLGHIVSVSRHQYILDGTLLVDEVTIDTNGQVPARFYYLTPVTEEMRGSGVGAALARMTERGQQMVERGAQVGGSQVHEMVQKKFPMTTHAKQIEYRVLSPDVLGQLYDSARTAWRTGRGRVFTVQ